MKKYRVFLLFVLFLVSCGREFGILRELDSVETYVHEYPDSALQVLESLDTAFVSSEKVAARYTLLNAIARFRLFINETDDAPLLRAADYFRAEGDMDRLMKSLFFAGYVQFHQSDYNQSIVSLTEAEMAVDALQDHYYGGLIERQLAFDFERTYNNVDRLRCIRLALKHFEEGQFETHANYALLMLGEAYTANSYYVEGEEVFHKVISVGKQKRDISLWSLSLLSYAENLVVRDDHRPEEAFRHILFVRDSLHRSLNCYVLATAGLAVAMTGDEKQSDSFFLEAEQSARTPYEKYLVRFRQYEASLHLNRSEKALEAAKESFQYLIDTHMRLERDSSVDSQRDYFLQVAENEKLHHQLTRQRLLTVLVSFTLVCVVLVWGVGKLLRKKRILQIQNDVLSAQVEDLERSHSGNLKRALNSGMRFFNKLAEFKWVNQPGKILPHFEAMMKDLATDGSTLAEMKKMLNETHGGLIDRLEEQVPTLKKDDLMIYCYLAHQFDHVTICTILNRTPGALNSKVYRIREKISHSSGKDKDEFLSVIKY